MIAEEVAATAGCGLWLPRMTMVAYAEVQQMAIAMGPPLGTGAVKASAMVTMTLQRLALVRGRSLREAVRVPASEEDEMSKRKWAGPHSAALPPVVAAGRIGRHLRRRGDTARASRPPARMR